MKKPFVLIHRANTPDKIAQSMNLQWDGVEIDLRATRDGAVVVHHDRRFKDGNGRNLWIDRVSFSEIKATSTEQIILFNDLLSDIIAVSRKRKSFILDIDIKQQQIHELVYKIVLRHNAFSYLSEIIVSSPTIWVLEACDRLDGRFKLALTYGPYDKWDLHDLKMIWYLAVVLQYTLKPFIFRPTFI